MNKLEVNKLVSIMDWGPKPFRFLDMWQEDKRFSVFVKENGTIM